MISDSFHNISISWNSGSATLTDMVFENRNKSFGAFQLRKNYGKHILLAFLISLLFLVLVFLPALSIADYSEVNIPKTTAIEETPKEILVDLSILAPKPINTIQESALPLKISNHKNNTSSDPEPEISTEVLVNEQEFSSSGTNIFSEELPNLDEHFETGGKGFNNSVGGVTENDYLVSDLRIELPQFRGNLNSFFQKHISYPAYAVRDGINQTITVEFVVGPEGTVLNARVVNPKGLDIEKEAIRVIMLTRWTAPKQNGLATKVKMLLPVVFRIED
ncbi:MAG: energy transducer TonB [Cytophagaceae bacterium]